MGIVARATMILFLVEEAHSFFQVIHIPESLLLDEKMVERVEAIWLDVQWVAGDYVGSLVGGLSDLSTIFQEEASEELAHMREVEQRLHRSVASLQRLHKTHMDSAWIRPQLEQA